MDEYFTFHTDSISITRGSNPVATSDYNVIHNPGDGCTFHIAFGEPFCSSLLKGATLVVTYTAELKKDVDVDTDHPNETWQTHTNDIETEHDITTAQTYKVQVVKKDQDGALLPGATFVLKDNISKFYAVDADGKVSWVDDVNNATQYTTTTENGCTVTFYGVDAEVFTLVEHVVPGGYTGTTDVIVNTKEVTDGVHSKSVTVTNTLGTALPEIGGIGTTVFYVMGGLMVVAAAILLITKKRTLIAE